MKFSWTVFSFADETRARIAPNELVRCEDGTHYYPTACEDVPPAIKVKWQGSLCSGDFYTDGYYPAQAIFNAVTLETAMSQAAERGIKLHPSPVISLPSRSTPFPKAVQTCTKLRERKPKENSKSVKSKVGNSSKLTKQSRSDVNQALSTKMKPEKTHTADQSCNSAIKVKPDKNQPTEHSDDEPEDSSKKKLKVNDAAHNPVLKTRLSSTFAKLGSNHLFPSEDKNSTVEDSKLDFAAVSHVKPASSSTHSDAEYSVQKARGDRKHKLIKQKADKSSKQFEQPSNANHSQNLKVKTERSNVNAADQLIQSVIKGTFNVDCLDEEDKAQQTLENEEGHADAEISSNPQYSSEDESEIFEIGCASVCVEKRSTLDAEHDGEDLNATVDIHELERSLPSEIVGIRSSFSSAGETSENESENSSGDEVLKALDNATQLKKENAALKEKLREEIDQTTLANNLRISYKEKMEELQTECDALKNRNVLLQDMLLKLKSRFDKLSAPRGSANEGKVSHSSPNQKDLVQSTASSKRHELKSVKAPIRAKIEDICHDGSENDANESPERTVTSKRPGQDSDETDANESFKGTTASKRSKSKSPKTNKRKAGDIDLDDMEMTLVSQKVLKHLRKEEPLQADKHGKVDVGHGIRWKVKVLEDITESCRLDPCKAAKNLTTHTWSETERKDRSLDGLKSNRFPGSKPKQMATPVKVKTILGAVKAMLEVNGEEVGPKMAKSLHDSRKAIGQRFAYDGFKSKNASKD